MSTPDPQEPCVPVVTGRWWRRLTLWATPRTGLWRTPVTPRMILAPVYVYTDGRDLLYGNMEKVQDDGLWVAPAPDPDTAIEGVETSQGLCRANEALRQENEALRREIEAQRRVLATFGVGLRVARALTFFAGLAGCVHHPAQARLVVCTQTCGGAFVVSDSTPEACVCVEDGE